MCHLWSTVHSNIKSFEECSFADSKTQGKSITYAKKFGGWYRSRNKDVGTGIKKQMKYGSIYAICRKWQRRTKNKEKTQSSLLIKVNDRNTRTRCEICSKLTIKTAERRQWMKYDISRLPSLAKP